MVAFPHCLLCDVGMAGRVTLASILSAQRIVEIRRTLIERLGYGLGLSRHTGHALA